MIPNIQVREQCLRLLGQDPTTLGAGNLTVILAQNDIAPSESTTLADIVQANFTGYAPIVAGGGNQAVALDPTNNNAVMDITQPAGGFRWVTSGSGNLPQTIYGIGLTDGNITTLWASYRFTNPIILTGNGQRIDANIPRLTLPANCFQ